MRPMPTLVSVVQTDPEILEGTPVFCGTRVPVKNEVLLLTAAPGIARAPR